MRRAAALPGLSVQGVAVHIGSQLTSLDPLERAFTRVGELIGGLREAGHAISVADLGGGLGVAYDPCHAAAEPGRLWRDGRAGRRRVGRPAGVRAGRLIVGNAGVLLSRVIRVKPGGGRSVRDRRCRDE